MERNRVVKGKYFETFPGLNRELVILRISSVQCIPFVSLVAIYSAKYGRCNEWQFYKVLWKKKEPRRGIFVKRTQDRAFCLSHGLSGTTGKGVVRLSHPT